MNKYRSTALALVCCAASVSGAACTAGITTAPPPTSAPPTRAAAPTRSASVAAAASNAASAGRMIAISGPSGRFPVPARAKVAENLGDSQAIEVLFNSVTPAQVSSFYATALPRAGYVISMNSVVTENGDTVGIVSFSGHGYKGTIIVQAKFTEPSVTIPGLGTKDVTTISLEPK
jgi:hypothetical protein